MISISVPTCFIYCAARAYSGKTKGVFIVSTYYDTYRSTLAALCKEQGVTEVSFGTSYLGRPIPALQLGHGIHRLLYVGGITGETDSTALLLSFVRAYTDGLQTGRRIAGVDLSYLHNTRTVTVVPLLNPDGAILRTEGDDPENPLLPRLRELCGREMKDWELNGRGVDLRYNYDVRFTSCMLSAEGIGHVGYPGARPESEPEAAALCRYLRGGMTDLAMTVCCTAAMDHPVLSLNAEGGTEYRTRTVAEILSSALSGCETDSTLRPGSLKDWYRTRSAGPLFELVLPHPGAKGGGGLTELLTKGSIL